MIVMDFALDDFRLFSLVQLGSGLTAVAAVKVLDPHSDLEASGMKIYAEGTTLNMVWGEYAKRAWKL